MIYLVFIILLLGVVLVVLNVLNQHKKKKQIQSIRLAWGVTKKEDFDFQNIVKYADGFNDNVFHRLSNQTIEDIDFNGLFAFIDRTTSRVGQQVLYKKIIEPSKSWENPLERFVTLFSNDRHLREVIQLELYKLNSKSTYQIPSLLKNKLPERPTWFGFLVLDVLVTVSLILLSFKFPVLLIFLLFPATLNMFLHLWNKGKTFRFFNSLPQLNTLINVSKVIIKKDDLLYDQSVEESISNLRSLQQKMVLIRFDDGNGLAAELGLLATYLTEAVKAVLLIEVFAFYKIASELNSKKQSIDKIFNYVGNIDSSISIASLRASKEKTCQPIFTASKKELNAENMYHPLITGCVGNNLSIRGKSILITGSNMSGKSTFLRTFAINSILAQTIYTCFADQFITPTLKQFSSIRIDDNLWDGSSYYLQEVKIMSSLIEQAKFSDQNLFILDEVFKGTNTVERIAAAKSILSYLNREENIVVVSTHDLELAEMLNQQYDLYHFTETVENSELHFDYLIKQGQLKTRNAIRILELSNYPVEIVQEARQICLSLEKPTS